VEKVVGYFKTVAKDWLTTDTWKFSVEKKKLNINQRLDLKC
jgi:hypothetical protein